jgi:hypothetical protein
MHIFESILCERQEADGSLVNVKFAEVHVG